MEPLQRLAAFYQVIYEDSRIRAGHISLYTALLLQWASGGCREPFSISRRQIMKLSRIRGQATYHKYIRELADFGYIKYIPSYHPGQKSLIYFR